MEAYLDNSATTRAFEAVRDVVVRTMMEDYGNPSSLHKKGMEAERYVKRAAEEIAKTLKASPSEIIFTSGGTESNNMAIIGGAKAARRKGNHIITSTIEHASVYNVFGHLEEEGWRVSYIPVDEYGRLNQEALLSRLDDETVLVSVMYVNNEIGSVNPIGEIGAMIKEKSPGTLFHVDAIQAYGKYRINPRREQIDLLSASGHKIHGPKGAGFLYVKNGVKIAPTVFGGGQQRGLRSGTHNVPGIAGLGEAARLIYENHEEKIAAMYRLKRLFVELVSALPDVQVNGYTDERQRPSYRERKLRRGEKRGAAPRPGGEGDLRILRFGLLLQSSGRQRHPAGNRPGTAVPGFHPALQLQHIHHGGRDPLLRGGLE